MADDKDLKRAMESVDKPRRTRASSTVPTPPRPAGPGGLARAISPSAHKPALRQVSVNDTFDYDVALNMAFLGAGQGGGRIANAFWHIGYRRVGVFNTTDTDFEGLDTDVPTLSLDIGGAAKDMQFARQSLRGREEEIRDLMVRAWGNTLDLALVCVGLGGGSGSGTAMPLVRLARKYMEDKGGQPRVGAVVSLPNPTEGQQVCKNALAAFKELLAEKVSPLLVIDNARIQQLYSPPMSRLLPQSNDIVSQLFHLFNRMAAVRSPYITFDRSEFTQLLDGGIIVLGSADIQTDSIQSPADVSKAIRDELANSILAQVDLATGRKAACLFVASEEVLNTFGLDYFDAGFTQLDRIVGSAYTKDSDRPTVIHRGVYPSTEPGLQCYTLVSELAPPHARLAGLAKTAGLRDAVSSMAKYLGVE